MLLHHPFTEDGFSEKVAAVSFWVLAVLTVMTVLGIALFGLVVQLHREIQAIG